MSERPPKVRAEGSDAVQRLLVTLGCGLGLGVLHRLSVFGLPRAEDAGIPLLPVALAPFMTAFVLVELVAFAVPALRVVRVGGAERRRGLDRTAWAVGGGLLVVQLLGLQRSLAETMVPEPWSLWAQWLAAEGAMLGLAVVASRRGLGSGWGLLLGVGGVDQLIGPVAVASRALANGAISPGVVLLPGVMVSAAAVWSLWLSRASRAWGPGKPSTTPFPVSTTSPWALGGVVASVPVTLQSWFDWGGLPQALSRSPVFYGALEAFVAFVCALVLGVLFFRPALVAQLWARWSPGVDVEAVTAAARSLLPRALLVSMAVLIGVPVVLLVLGGSFPSGTLFLMSAVVVALVAADLFDEFQVVRRVGPLVNVWELQRTAEVEPMVRAMAEQGVEAYPRAFGARSTQQFFAPWMPVCILVPKSQEAVARAFIASRVG